MLKNFIQYSWRRFLKEKVFTTLNLLGLSLGVAFVVIIFLLVSYLTGFDGYHKFSDRIYRVNTQSLENEDYHYTSGVPKPLGPRMASDIPGIEKITSVYYNVGGLITVQEEDGTISRYNENSGIAYLDTVFYEIFTREVLEGDLKATFSKPDFVALSKSAAEKYFGDKIAIGKTITLDNSLDFVVGAVMEDYGEKTHFPFDVMISYETYRRIESEDMDNWYSTASDYQTYMLLDQHTSNEKVEAGLEEIVSKYVTNRPEGTLTYYLQPLSELHFDTRTSNYLYRTVPKSTILTLSVVGLLLMLTACINFINMSTAQAIKRSREVGIRKTLGSSKLQLVFRYLGETSIVCFLAILVGLGLSELLLMEINQLLEVDLHIDQAGYSLITFLLFAWLAMSAMAGLYPAMVMSRYSPVQALRSSASSGKGGSIYLRRGLVIFQFIVSQLLIISTVIIMTQTDFLKNAPLGFDKDLVVLTSLPEQDPSKLNVLRNALLSSPEVENVSFGLAPPASGSVWGTNLEFGDEDISIHIKLVDSAYLSTYGIKLMAGRFLGNSDTIRNLVINETLAQMLSQDDPEDILGQNVRLYGRKLQIIGIVEDFHATSLTEVIKPLVFTNYIDRYRVAGVKIKPNHMESALEHVENSWKEVFPQYIYDYSFLDDSIARFYDSENKMTNALMLFVVVTLFIGCLGLYGLVAFMVNNKTKEVGIRKALGATTGQVMRIFVSEFLLLVLIAFVVSAPIGSYVMDQWLTQFAYRIDLQVWMFVLTFGIVASITLATVGYKSLKASSANPVDALRIE